jgi:alpha-N-arabinofuranosidase
MSEWVEYITLEGVSPMTDLRKKNGRQEPWTLPFFGVGNESWGCGGHMTPEFYADQFLRYATYVRVYNKEKPICKIACGPNEGDYNWTEVLMKKAAPCMDALTMHYYTILRDANRKKSAATGFPAEEYRKIIDLAYKMEELVTRHSEIMNRYDPEKRVALFVDEWGTWYQVEPGTNPGFLYQQNTMRDAIVAAMTLNIFNKHSDRVRMANIAQLVNVLQSVVLTDGEEMLLTPTYHVFLLFREHHNNTLLGSFITNPAGEKGRAPQLMESASVDSDGQIISTVVNTSAEESAEIECQIADFKVGGITAEILTGELGAYNTFEAKDTVCTAVFNGFEPTADGFKATLPPCSVVRFVIR